MVPDLFDSIVAYAIDRSTMSPGCEALADINRLDVLLVYCIYDYREGQLQNLLPQSEPVKSIQYLRYLRALYVVDRYILADIFRDVNVSRSTIIQFMDAGVLIELENGDVCGRSPAIWCQNIYDRYDD